MSTLDMLEKELIKLDVYENNIPDIVYNVADSISSRNIPYRMKIALAISEIITFISQFKINILHWNGSIIPINSIMFCIAKSGASKDSSLRAVRKCFKSAYELISETRNNLAIEKAIELAKNNNTPNPELFSYYKEYYRAPNPLFIGIPTGEGFIQHLNDLDEDELGAGYIYSGELSSELQSNSNIGDVLKILSETYDTGTKEVKIIKTRESQSREIKNMPVSALFQSSQDTILYDESVKKRFRLEFTSKLARRSFFIFVDEVIENKEYTSISDLLTYEQQIEDNASKITKEMDNYFHELCEALLEIRTRNVEISKEVRELFTLYKKYNELTSDTIDNQYPIAKLSRAHLQWKALKLSGALALIDYETTIQIKHYKAAIEFIEKINNDIINFEKELLKESYEVFVSYVHTYAIKGYYSIGLHYLKKAGFIPLKNNTEFQVRELIKLANSYDTQGVYELKGDNVEYKELIKKDNILVSYVYCTGTKQEKAVKCVNGFNCEELKFEDLEEMLKDDYAYSPFKFQNGVRGKDNIISGCKWIVLDIDDSEITDEETHILLSDINHYIVRTSNKDNPNKYRLLLELDTEINLTDMQWKPFITLLTNDLGIKCDKLPKSQIFFSYKNRDILKVLDQNTIDTKKYLVNLADNTATISKLPSPKQCNKMLEDKLTTFEKAFNAKDGEGRRKLIWACRYARELGADRDYCKNLITEITEYWVKGFPEEDLETMKKQLDRWIF